MIFDDLLRLYAAGERKFSGITLVLDTPFRELDEWELQGINLSGAIFKGADLQRITLMTAEELLERYEKGERDFSGVDFRSVDLANTTLPKINLSGTNLSEANFVCAMLSGANLADCIFDGANLSNTNLSRANLIEASLMNVNLAGAILDNALLGNNPLLDDADLSGVDLSKADMDVFPYS